MKETSWLYYFGKFVLSFLYKVGWGYRATGVEYIPAEGPVIIASNHRSYADPPLVGIGIPRTVHFLAKKELFSFKPFGWLITRLNAHPLNRSSGIAALRLAEEILEEGGVIIVFPEGKRINIDELAPPKPGVGLLSIKTNIPVVPAYIHNSGHLFKLKRVSVTYGVPVLPQNFNSYQALAEEVMGRIQKMKDQIQSKI